MTLTPRHKLFAAVALTALVPLIASVQGASNIARVLLGLSALTGIAFWFIRARGGLSSQFKKAPRLQVIQRVGLSQRNGIALVEVDGKPYLVVHGDGFARMRPTRQPRQVTALKLVTTEGVAS
jgi:flagellar protein FliO/FliZ